MEVIFSMNIIYTCIGGVVVTVLCKMSLCKCIFLVYMYVYMYMYVYFTIRVCYCVSVLPGRAAWEKFSVEEVLGSVQLESLVEIFQKEHITMDVLVEMTNDDLQSIGVTAFGHRHKILRRVKELTCSEEEIGTSSVCVHKHASM